MKKVLFVHSFYRQFGGEDSNITDEINLLKKEYTVKLLSFSNSKLGFFDLVAFLINSNKKSNEIFQKEILSFKPDVVYFHNSWFKSNLGLFKIAKKNNIKILVKIHNFRYLCCASFLLKNHIYKNTQCYACGYNRIKKAIFNKYFNNSYLKSFFVIWHTKKYLKILKNYNLKIFAISELHKRYLEESGISENKIFLFNNPINYEISNENTYNPKSNYILFAGRLEKDKGVEELLSTWQKASLTNTNLYIAGKGQLFNKLNTKFETDEIKFLGQLSHIETLDYIKNAKAVITNTQTYEGQPRLLCEASSLGVPSLFPSFGGMVEFFPDDYEYSFKKFDEESLLDALLKTTNNEVLLKESERVKNFILKKLKKNKLLEEFEAYIL